MWVLQSCQKPKEDQKWLASAFVGLGPPGTKNPYYIGPLILRAMAVLGCDLGGSRLSQGCHQAIINQLNKML